MAMNALSFLRLVVCLPLLFGIGSASSAEDDGVRVRLQTNLGDILLELDAMRAPNTVENFMRYVDEGFYDGTIFHRVITGFMIQGGGFTQRHARKRTGAPVRNEAENGLRHDRGTIAMARTADPHSATAQFFINVVDNHRLDHTAKTPDGWGYAVFGRVVEGMDVVDRIAALETGPGGPFARDVPKNPAIIERASRHR